MCFEKYVSSPVPESAESKICSRPWVSDELRTTFCGYHLATICGKIPIVECAIVDMKTAQPNWNSLKN
jgi:hypothetical protein